MSQFGLWIAVLFFAIYTLANGFFLMIGIGKPVDLLQGAALAGLSIGTIARRDVGCHIDWNGPTVGLFNAKGFTYA